MSKPLPKVYLTACEVCERYGISSRTLHNWSRGGLLSPLWIRRRRYFALEDLEAFEAAHREHGPEA